MSIAKKLVKPTKIKLMTTLKLARKHGACQSGIDHAVKHGAKENKEFNLLILLNENHLNYFFWAWRCTTKAEKKVKRLILHDIVDSVRHVYENEYPNDPCIKNVLMALSTGLGLKEAASAAYAEAFREDDIYSVAYAAADAAEAANTRSAASAYSAAFRAADAVWANADERQKQIQIIKKYLE